MTRLVTFALCAPIHFYRRFISPLEPALLPVPAHLLGLCAGSASRLMARCAGLLLAVRRIVALPSHLLARRFVGL